MSPGTGRFAPSPTGPLHLGSLLAATASFLDARSRGDRWFVRLDDLDTRRNAPGADAAILASLEAHGLHWDARVFRQSERLERYREALADLAAAGRLFYCTCSRRQLSSKGPYPGICRDCATPRPNSALRVRVDATPIVFHDLLRGRIADNLADTVGDFVVRRRDGVVAYQLATAVDDGESIITRVVRGADLLDNTARQLFLMRQLGLSPPDYAHIPVLVNAQGRKLSKQTRAPALDDDKAAKNLARALGLLGLGQPEEPAGSCEVLLGWAIPRFSLASITAAHAIQVP